MPDDVKPAVNADTGAAGDKGAETPWTEGLPDEVKSFFGEAKSLDEFKASIAPPAAPEKYVAPEGMEIDEQAFGQFAEVAKGLNLTQAQAEALLKFDAARMAGYSTAAAESQAAGLKAMASELGKEKYDATVNAALKTMKAFASPEDIAFLEGTGMGNHPSLIKLMARIGSALSEEQFAGATGPAKTTEPVAPADRLYPKQKQ